MDQRPPILDAIAVKAAQGSYIRFNPAWRPGERDKYICEKEPLTHEVLDAHWYGHMSIGVHVMEPGSDTTRLAVLDLDNHADKDGNRPYDNDEFESAFSKLLSAATNHELNPLPVKTSDDGYHAVMTWTEPQSAKAVRGLLAKVCEEAGVDCEVFPKQDKVAENGYGSDVSLVGGRDSTLLDAELQPVPKEQWHTAQMFVSPPVRAAAQEERQRPVQNAGGILAEIEQGAVADGNRNDALKTLLVRLRKQNGFEETGLRMMAVGFAQDFGMPMKEALSLVRFAANLPLEDVAGFGQLVKIVPKYRTDISAARYRLEYNGQWVRLGSTEELRSKARVQNAILDQLGDLPNLTVGQWREMLPQLVARMVTHETEGEATEDMIWELIVTYLASRFEAQAKEFFTQRQALLQGYPFLDGSQVVFKPAPLMAWINRTRTVKVKQQNILDVLRSRGIGDRKTFSINNKNENVYWVEFTRHRRGHRHHVAVGLRRRCRDWRGAHNEIRLLT